MQGKGCEGDGGRSYSRRRPEESALFAAVRENLAEFLEQADGVGRGAPKFLREQLQAYLRCGVLAHGFARVRCDACKVESLVAFSCKGLGTCPSCDAKRAALSAAHLTEEVLPEAPYRQWTLSFPFSLRFPLARTPQLLSRALLLFVRALFSHQRAVARRLGFDGKVRTGAVAFVQRFGSALQVTPHFHLLLPEGVFCRVGDRGLRFQPLPPPSTDDVQRLLVKVRKKVLDAFRAKGLLDDVPTPEDALEALQAQGVQRTFPWNELDLKTPPTQKPRTALLDGFSLHADTHVHAHDRKGLEALCRYGARGPIALGRLSRREDGKFVYRMKRRRADGSSELVLTGMQLLTKLVALVPPKGSNLVRYFGVFAPGAAPRAKATPPEPLEPSSPADPEKQPPLRKRGRLALDWAALLRRTFAFDVFACPCGGRRRVLAVINNTSAARQILEHLGLPATPPKIPPAQGPPEQLELVA